MIASASSSSGTNPRSFIDSASEIDKVASRSYLPGMKTVGLKVLKNKLSEYVRIAAGGETVLVTDRGRVVVEMNAPHPANKHGKKESVIERGIREGWITPATRRGPPPPPPPAVMTLEELLKDLAWRREDR